MLALPRLSASLGRETLEIELPSKTHLSLCRVSSCPSSSADADQSRRVGARVCALACAHGLRVVEGGPEAGR